MENRNFKAEPVLFHTKNNMLKEWGSTTNLTVFRRCASLYSNLHIERLVQTEPWGVNPSVGFLMTLKIRKSSGKFLHGHPLTISRDALGYSVVTGDKRTQQRWDVDVVNKTSREVSLHLSFQFYFVRTRLVLFICPLIPPMPGSEQSEELPPFPQVSPEWDGRGQRLNPHSHNLGSCVLFSNGALATSLWFVFSWGEVQGGRGLELLWDKRMRWGGANPLIMNLP